jgi:hypothetical protein
MTSTTEFKVFACTCDLLKKLDISMDHTPTDKTTDSESNEVCCGCLQCMFCWPMGLIFDILSCPCRFTYYKCKK